MNCRTFEDRVYDLCDGELKAADERVMLAHAENCPACRRLLRTHRMIVEQLESLPRFVPPPETASAVMAAIRERERQVWREKALQWSSVAAMFLAGVVGLFFHTDLFRTAAAVGGQIDENVGAGFQRVCALFSQSASGLADGANNLLTAVTGSLPDAMSQTIPATGAILLLLAGLAVIATNYRLLREAAQD